MGKRIADEYVGVWQRRGIRVGDSPAVENSCVLWLQSPSRYADIRVPAPGQSKGARQAFAGGLRWSDPTLTFLHDLDFTGNHPDDQGDLTWEGETLVETGSAEVRGKTVHYQEYWYRLSPINPDFETWEMREQDALVGIAMRVGSYAHIVGHAITQAREISQQDHFGAAHYMMQAGVWSQQALVGGATTNVFADALVVPWVLVESAACGC